MRITTLSPKKSSSQAIIDNVASDKSISHRAIIFAFLSDKKSKIRNFLLGQDTLNTLKIAMQLGMCVFANDKKIKHISEIPQNGEIALIRDERGILEPSDILDCGNAGTAIRLYLGLLSTQKGHFVLSGDEYLRIRPMKRVIAPLNNIGAKITARCDNNLAPISIKGQELETFSYHSEISSAQVKSAMILAALNAQPKKSAKSQFSEIALSRDHSERMLNGMGANLQIDNNTITITPLKSPLKALDLTIPSDPSSAFYFAILALIANKNITIKNMLLNKTRIEAFNILKSMGANIEFDIKESAFEDIGDVIIYKDAPLKAIIVEENIAWLIDEIPALAVLFAFVGGKSIVKNAAELRTKESDRIKATLDNLAKLGIRFEEFDDGFAIVGGFKIPDKKVIFESYGDHRIAMSFAILGAICEIEILDSACIDVSFPNFLDIISQFMEVKNMEHTSAD